MRKDPTEFRKRFAAWKNGKQPYKDGLPAYDDGTKDISNYDDVIYKNMYWQGNDVSPEYQQYVRGGTPEDVSLSFVKEQVNRYPDQYYIKGPTLPEVVVKPDPDSTSTALLTTYYPWSDDFPVTGHSTLRLTHNRDDWDSASAAFITAYGSDPWYNFVTNNCSDATRKAIEFATGKKINPVFFTTPGDVKDFVESELGGKSEYRTDGSVETVFNIPTKQARRLVEYSKRLNKIRFLHRRNKKYAE